MQGKLARPVWGWGPGETPGPTPLFIGSLAAGDRAAGFFTLVTSAVRNDLDVWAYLDDVIRRLLAGETNYGSLRPDTWATAHPEAIRQYRKDERRDKADRKHAERASRRAMAYNESRLHSAIGYVTPLDKLAGRAEAIHEARNTKLEAAREARRVRRLKQRGACYTDDTHEEDRALLASNSSASFGPEASAEGEVLSPSAASTLLLA